MQTWKVTKYVYSSIQFGGTTLYLNPTTFQRQSLYILLLYNYLKAAVTVTLQTNALNTIKYDVYTLWLVKHSLCQPPTT